MHSGLVGILQQQGWLLGSSMEWMQPDLDLAYRPMPVAKEAKTSKLGTVTANEWMIPAGTKQVEGGWQVLKWFATEPVALKMATMDTLLPGRKSVTSSAEYQKLPFSKVWVEIADKGRPEDIFVSAS